MPGTCFRTPSLRTAFPSIKWRNSNQNFEGINYFPIHATCPTGRAFLVLFLWFVLWQDTVISWCRQ